MAAAPQTARGQDAPQAAQAKATSVPPPRVTVDIIERPLTIGARQDVLYDTNIVQGSREAAGLRSLEKAEFIVTPSATLDLGHNDGRVGVALNGGFGYDFHEKNKVLDRERIDFVGTATGLVGSSCSVTGKYVYLRKQTRQSDLTTIVTGNRVLVYVATLGQTCISPGGLTQSIQLLRSAWHNSSALNINNNRKAASALLGYTNPAFGTLGAIILYERTNFFGRPEILVMTPDKLEKTNIGIQYTSPVDELLFGTLAAGYVYSEATVSPESRLAGARDRNGLVAQATLSYKPNHRLRIGAQAARRIRHDTSFTITTDLQLAVDYALFPKVQASIGGRWLRDRYFGRDVTLPQIAQDLQDQTTLYANLAFEVAPRTTLLADVRRDIGKADFSPFDYSGTRLMLTLSSSFENPFR